MTTPSPDQPDRRKATRLQGYDYAQAGGYFVTIVSHNRAQIFGEITGELATLSAIGEILRACWCEIPQHFPNVSLDEFVIMPNHLHGIIFIHESAVVGATHASPLPRGPTPGSLAAIIGSFKSSVSRYVHALPRLDGMKIW
jgi:putative transposase